ncbi:MULTISPECIES: hypothetical protein [unclassified Kitasatospora]|uniref:hypothetical protein n=1 Tax=unclassified Kitasatospora TaxID=2633591 RepID=UPI0007092B0D|nr:MULTISPECIES: hypothetical protein [unclassified Kitasatospora]KQV05415.1 hypothetical protein ASC99_11265 [Kitasatospora sp. Root107]KRB62221.1 hypothetical protein ASE03_06210 [Kitasatospora sp. Root187]
MGLREYRRIDVAFLGVAALLAFVMPLTREISWVPAVVLIACLPLGYVYLALALLSRCRRELGPTARALGGRIEGDPHRCRLLG